MIDLRYDTCSSRPHKTTTFFELQGEAGSYRSITNEIWLETKSPEYKWEPTANYATEYDHPDWKRWAKEAAGKGHGGADFFVVKEFVDAVREGRRPPVDVVDAVTWSAIIPLSTESIRAGSNAVPFPDFRKGIKQTVGAPGS